MDRTDIATALLTSGALDVGAFADVCFSVSGENIWLMSNRHNINAYPSNIEILVKAVKGGEDVIRRILEVLENRGELDVIDTLVKRVKHKRFRRLTAQQTSLNSQTVDYLADWATTVNDDMTVQSLVAHNHLPVETFLVLAQANNYENESPEWMNDRLLDAAARNPTDASIGALLGASQFHMAMLRKIVQEDLTNVTVTDVLDAMANTTGECEALTWYVRNGGSVVTTDIATRILRANTDDTRWYFQCGFDLDAAMMLTTGSYNIVTSLASAERVPTEALVALMERWDDSMVVRQAENALLNASHTETVERCLAKVEQLSTARQATADISPALARATSVNEKTAARIVRAFVKRDVVLTGDNGGMREPNGIWQMVVRAGDELTTSERIDVLVRNPAVLHWCLGTSVMFRKGEAHAALAELFSRNDAGWCTYYTERLINRGLGKSSHLPDVLDLLMGAVSQLVDTPQAAQLIVDRVTARFGDDRSAYEAFISLAATWEGTLPELLEAVSAIQS